MPCRGSQGHDLRVGGRVASGLPGIRALTDDLSSGIDHHGAHRHLANPTRCSGEVESVSQPRGIRRIGTGPEREVTGDGGVGLTR